MKNISILSILSIFLFSCNNNNVTISKEKYDKLIKLESSLNKVDTVVKSEYPKPFKLYTEGLGYLNKNGIVLGSDEHEYLVITDYLSNSVNIGHYIDCEKCKKNTSCLLK